MKATIRLFQSDGKSPNGYPIKLILSAKLPGARSTKVKRHTIGHSFETDWEPASQLPLTSHEDFEDLYTMILDYRKKAAKLEFRNLEDFDDALDYLTDKKEVKSESFYDFADQRISYLKSIGKTGNARTYQIAVDQLQKFAPKLKFKDLSYPFLESYKEFKKTEKNYKTGEIGISNSSLHNYLRTLRAIYNSAVKKRVTEDQRPFDGIFDDIRVSKLRQKNHYLDKNLIKKLRDADLQNRGETMARDLAFLQFYFAGVDFSDLYYLKRSEIRNGRIWIERKKLAEDKRYQFDLRIFDCTWELMKKYEDDDPESEFFFYWKGLYNKETFRTRTYRNLQKLKKRLEIELLPVDSTFTLKVMRHSFKTIGKFMYLDADLIRELMNHERTADIDTVYADVFPEKDRDAVHWKIIDLD